MALIVEDGSIVSGANSYVTRSELIVYAGARGVVLVDDETTDVLAIKAMDYLALFDNEWRGNLVMPGVQDLAWPREYAKPAGSFVVYPDDEIPGAIKRAQMQLVLHAKDGTILLPTFSADTAFVTKEKVDVIETEYSEAVAIAMMGQLPSMPLVKSLLGPWLKNVGGLTTVRV